MSRKNGCPEHVWIRVGKTHEFKCVECGLTADAGWLLEHYCMEHARKLRDTGLCIECEIEIFREFTDKEIWALFLNP